MKPAFFILALMFPLSPLSRAAEPDLEVGQPFPVVQLPLMDGKESRSIADYAGKKTVLHLFASW